MESSQAVNPRHRHLRAAAPAYIRWAALAALGSLVIGLVYGLIFRTSDPDFRMKGFPTSLSTDVVASIDNYERQETENGVVKYYIRADRALTFSDQHQELDNVFLQVFDTAGESSDRITAKKAIYVPEEGNKFKAYFAGAVEIETRDALKVKTENLTYDHATETAAAEEAIAFERGTVRGTAVGATVDAASKRIELTSSVKIETSAASGSEPVNLQAERAAYDQAAEKVELSGSVHVASHSEGTGSPSYDVRSGNANVFLSGPRAEELTFSKVELFDNVEIETRRGSDTPSRLTGSYALYEREADRFTVRGGVTISTAADGVGTVGRAREAVYEQKAARVSLNDSAQVEQGGDLIRGDQLVADLYPTKKIRFAKANGNAYLRNSAIERTTEISGAQLDASFGNSENLVSANATGSPNIVVTPANVTDYSRIVMNAPRAIRAAFKGAGLLDTIQSEGRTTIRLDAPNQNADAANKSVTADKVSSTFDAEGKHLTKVEAVGNAELNIEPLQALPQNYKTAVNAPRFDCIFYPTGNNVRRCDASTKTRSVRTPTLADAGRGTQTMTSDTLAAHFIEAGRDVERFDARGNAKFVELDRNASAGEFAFTPGDGIVRLRGGAPTAWDNTARAKAPEIDWFTREQRSSLRGGVSTTYYSQKQTRGSTPFAAGERPVYITAAQLEADHQNEVGVYTGNARAWQDKNYVRANVLTIRQKEGRLFGEGAVQSLLSDVKRSSGGTESRVPVYASSERMSYDNGGRVLRYEENVEIRQGTDRLTGAVASIFLDENNDVSRSDIENTVTLTQPGRTATGDFARYTASDESVYLRGQPARINDAKNGSSQGAEMTLYLRENRVIGSGATQRDPAGRVRSVIKLKNE